MRLFRRLRLHAARERHARAETWQRHTRARYAQLFGLRSSDWPLWARYEHARLLDDVTKARRRVERLSDTKGDRHA